MGKHIIKAFKIEAARMASQPGNTQTGVDHDPGMFSIKA
jgi:hypothetical protein